MKTLSRNLAVAVLCGLSFLPQSFAAKPRLALVIGNSDYNIENGRLPNARGDAEQVAGQMRGLGFEVILRIDIRTRAELKKAVEGFIGQAGGREIALVYYSGHGLQHDDHNYLIPTQETISQAYQVEDNALSVDYLLKGMKAMGPQLGVVILDACRTNPFPKSDKGASRGLTRIKAPSDIVVAYATEPGSVADDGDGTHSPYAQALLSHLQDPASTALPVTEFFNRVGVTVEQLSGGEQSPRLELPPLHYTFCFRHCNDVAPSASEPQRAETAPSPKPVTPAAETLIAGRYRDNGDGTVTDVKTNLQWMRCLIGQHWKNSHCEGKYKDIDTEFSVVDNWVKNSQSFAGYDDWRLPHVYELQPMINCFTDEKNVMCKKLFVQREAAWGTGFISSYPIFDRYKALASTGYKDNHKDRSYFFQPLRLVRGEHHGDGVWWPRKLVNFLNTIWYYEIKGVSVLGTNIVIYMSLAFLFSLIKYAKEKLNFRSKIDEKILWLSLPSLVILMFYLLVSLFGQIILRIAIFVFKNDYNF